MGFLSQVEKQRLLALAQKAKGFNINVAQYRNAATYEAGLDLFFKNLLDDLKDLNSLTMNTKTVAALQSKRDVLRNDIKNFCWKISHRLGFRIEEYVKFALEDKQNTEEKKEIFNEKVNEYRLQFTKELTELNKKATTYLNHNATFQLELRTEYIKALQVWKNLNYDYFVDMLSHGRIDWITDIKKDPSEE
jgi:hypothetical protein